MQVNQVFDGFGYTRTAPEKRSSKSQTRKKSQQIQRYPQGNPQPKDPIGQHLSDLFPNGWDWIYTPAPEGDEGIDWQTIKAFPLTPSQMWEYHQDPDCLIGIRPKDQTRWIAIDLDRHSPHHPAQNPDSLTQIRNALEDIGICRIQINQSSHSGGLHIYCPLPETVSSFWLSITVKYALETINIPLKSGECELFPNPKKYIPRGQGFSNYAALRMPMQPHSGFIPLDDDLNPQPWSLQTWLTQFENQSQQQDFPRLKRAIANARDNFKIRKNRNPKSIANWQNAIAREKAEGWTGPGQTNEKLKTFACEARVFLGLDSLDEIAEHIHRSAINSPGYQAYCQHTRDIRKRSYEVATWAMKYYWPYGSAPKRSTTYQSTSDPKIIDFGHHQRLQQESQEKIKSAFTRLESAQTLAPGISDRAQQLTQEAKVSRKTLYKPQNLELWHPKFTSCPEPNSESTTAPPIQSIPQDKQAQPHREQECFHLSSSSENSAPVKSPQPLLNKECFHPPLNEGFEVPLTPERATTALPPQGQRAVKVASHLTSPSNVPVSPLQNVLPITNWDELKASLPPRLQAKITQKQRQLACSDPKQDSFPVCSNPVSQFLEVSPSHVSVSHREPTVQEQAEFEAWYALAQDFNLVTDYDWQMREYLVLSKGEWLPYTELSSAFTMTCLKRCLNSPALE